MDYTRRSIALEKYFDPPEKLYPYTEATFPLETQIKMKEDATMLLVFKDATTDDMFYQPVQGKQYCYR